MIISHSRQFVFVHIHKAGGTSVEKALDPFLAWNDLILGGSPFGEKIQTPYAKRFGLNKHSTVAEIESVCGARTLDEYFVFALVRHPVARICSIYNFVASAANRIAGQLKVPLAELPNHATPKAKKKMPGLTWLSTRIFLETKGFSEFIRHPQIARAPGFRAQTAILARTPGAAPCGEIYRLEDYPDWKPALSKRLQLDFELLHANASSVRLIDSRSISAEDKDFVASLFRSDFETFGY